MPSDEPSTDRFDAQDQTYRDSILPPSVWARVAVEAGVTDFWRKYVGLRGEVHGIDSFGESAPGPDVFEHFGFTAKALAAFVSSQLG